jgi:N-acetylmuramoyl-L-alanine amidase
VSIPRLLAHGGALALSAALAACTPPPATTSPEPRPAPAPPVYVPLTAGLPAIPSVEGPLAIRLIAPEAGEVQPRRDSAFLYGSVGSGGASLRINDAPVAVAANGAFLAYLPVPADGAWRLVAERGGTRADTVYHYRPRPSGAPSPSDSASESGAPAVAATALGEAFATARPATVVRGADTLATGSDIVYGRPTPSGPYRWFFPRGTRLSLTARRGGQYRVDLPGGSQAWVDTGGIRLSADPLPPVAAATGRRTLRAGPTPELRVPAGFAPFLVEADSAGLHLTVYGAGGGELDVSTDDFVLAGAQRPLAPNVLRVDVALSRWLWGYRAWYDADGSIVVVIRRPPRIDPASPLRGIRIVVDPGHPPAGATGPTGYQEKDANLAIGLRLAERLRAAGALVSLTRSADVAVDLSARPAQAVRENADLLVSVHNNAFGLEANPFRDHGTSTYYFHTLSADLARDLDREIAATTGIPDLGAKWGNLALVRPSWMPSVLTESLFMPIPEQENALRDPGFLDRLADAHLRGIEAFLRRRAGAVAP